MCSTSGALRPRERQDAHALPSGCVDGVGHSRPDWRDARLSHACRSLGAWHDVDLDLRHLVEAQNFIAVEVALLHGAAFDGQLRFHDSTQPEADAPFHLSADHVGVDGHAAIDSANDPLDLGLATLVEAHLGDLGDVGVKRLGDSDAAEPAVGKWSIPPRLRGREPQHTRMPGVILKEIEPERDRVLAGGLRDLIQERLDGIGRVRRSDRPPPQHGNTDVRGSQLNAQVRDCIRDRRRALD